MKMIGDGKESDERKKWQGGCKSVGCVHRNGCIDAVAVPRRECTEEDSRGNQQVAVAEQQQQQDGSDSSGGSGSRSGSSVARSGSGL